jgi:hypothetical protein
MAQRKAKKSRTKGRAGAKAKKRPAPRRAKAGRKSAAKKTARRASGGGRSDARVAALQAENRRLREELEALRAEREAAPSPSAGEEPGEPTLPFGE